MLSLNSESSLNSIHHQQDRAKQFFGVHQMVNVGFRVFRAGQALAVLHQRSEIVAISRARN